MHSVRTTSKWDLISSTQFFFRKYFQQNTRASGALFLSNSIHTHFTLLPNINNSPETLFWRQFMRQAQHKHTCCCRCSYCCDGVDDAVVDESVFLLLGSLMPIKIR